MPKLTVEKVESLEAPSKLKRYADGEGLYLVVTPAGSKQWVLRIQHMGRRTDMGLGRNRGYPLISLKEARRLARELRASIIAGQDPLELRRQSRAIPTFEAAAKSFHRENQPGWADKTAALWLRTMEDYAFPRLGKVRLDRITFAMVRDCLLPIWLEKPETARRVFQRIGAVLTWGAAKGYRETDMQGDIVLASLPKQQSGVKHHKAMPWADLPPFMEKLGADTLPSHLALQFLILTAARSEEIREATWQEIDLDAGLWIVPASRMKMRRDASREDHIVPLSAEAKAVLEKAKALRRPDAQPQNDYVFPSGVTGGAMSDAALSRRLKVLGSDVTVHGFRATFRSWQAAKTNFGDDVGEKALAHATRSKVVAAYMRDPLVEKRRRLMSAWGAYVCRTPGKVVALPSHKTGAKA